MDHLANFIMPWQSALSILCALDSAGLGAFCHAIDIDIETMELWHQQLGGLMLACLSVGWYPPAMLIQPGK
jgi:hypothetical protein